MDDPIDYQEKDQSVIKSLIRYFIAAAGVLLAIVALDGWNPITRTFFGILMVFAAIIAFMVLVAWAVRQ